MINRLNLLNKLSWFGLNRDRVSDNDIHPESRIDAYQLETIICLESVLDTCYQTLGWLVHNQTIRKECQEFKQHTQHHQEELRRIFPLSQESETAIADKTHRYLMHLEPPYLFLKGVINLALNLTARKIEIYKSFFHKDQEHRDLLGKLVQDSIEEMVFLRRERAFHQNNLSNSHN